MLSIYIIKYKFQTLLLNFVISLIALKRPPSLDVSNLILSLTY